jgi:acyl carrier protein
LITTPERLSVSKTVSVERLPMSIRDQVHQFITTNFYVPDLQALADETSFLDTGIIDSTGVLELVGYLQEQFGVVLEDGEIVPENLDSVANIVGLIQRKAG